MGLGKIEETRAGAADKELGGGYGSKGDGRKRTEAKRGLGEEKKQRKKGG